MTGRTHNHTRGVHCSLVIRHRHSAAADDNSTWGERKCDGQGKRDGRLEAAWHHRLVREKATHSDEHEHDGHDEVSEEGEPEDLRIPLRRLSTAV